MDRTTLLARGDGRPLYGHADLRRLVAPRSVAVVGASPTPGSFGHRSLANLGFGFQGRVYPVNPRYEAILDHRCYASIADLPEVPDAVVLTVPRDQVLPNVEQCAARGVGGVVIYTSGFAETATPEGIALQRRMVDVARAANMRILGPNCVGVMNFVDRLGLTFQSGLDTLPMMQGPIGVVSQSGALGFILIQGMERGIGFSHDLSPGNSCDVDVCDLANYLVDDPQTAAIALLFEGVHDGARFTTLCERALRAGKPLIACKMGTSRIAQQATLSHTGTLAGSTETYAALFRRYGVIQVHHYEEILETAAYFARAGRPTTCGVGVMSASGGAAVMAADRAEEVGLSLPPLAPETSAKLGEVMPGFGSNANPCDITAASLHDMTMYGRSIRAFVEDPSFAAVVVPMMTAYAPNTIERARYLDELAGSLAKPVCIVWLNEWYQGPGAEVYDASRTLYMFRSMGRCVATLKRWIDYHATREACVAALDTPPPHHPHAAAAREALLRFAPGSTLTERAAKEVLALHGVRTTREALATSADDAWSRARAIGLPVAMKAESARIAHKTEAGVVRLGLATESDVRRAYDEIMTNARRVAGSDVAGVLVQEMVPAGVEVMVGARNDPQFGPVVLCGLGGVAVELLRDVAVAMAPVTLVEAQAMLRSLRSHPLLTGFRGSAPVDLDALAGVVVAVSQLAWEQRSQIAEIDVNPVIARPDGTIAVDALIVRATAD